MGIEEYEKFIKGETIEGRGTQENKYVCFMPEAPNALIDSWFSSRGSRYEKSPIKIDGSAAIQSLTGIVTSQIYVKFNLDDDKLNEMIDSESARMKYARYIDDGLSGDIDEPNTTNLIWIEEFQAEQYSKEIMNIEEVYLLNNGLYSVPCKLNMDDNEIIKIAKAQSVAPFVLYDDKANIALISGRIENLNKTLLKEFPDTAIVICDSCYGTEIGTKHYFSREFEENENTQTELAKMCFNALDKIPSQDGTIIHERADESLRKIYEFKGLDMPEEMQEYFKLEKQAKKGMSSSSISSSTVLLIDDKIYIPVGLSHLAKSEDGFISQEQLIEKLIHDPGSKITQIGPYEEAKISNAKDFVNKISIEMDGEIIDFDQIKRIKTQENEEWQEKE